MTLARWWHPNFHVQLDQIPIFRRLHMHIHRVDAIIVFGFAWEVTLIHLHYFPESTEFWSIIGIPKLICANISTKMVQFNYGMIVLGTEFSVLYTLFSDKWCTKCQIICKISWMEGWLPPNIVPVRLDFLPLLHSTPLTRFVQIQNQLSPVFVLRIGPPHCNYTDLMTQ